MFNEYPYVNLQDVNLDWILKHIKELETNLQDFIKLNTIKYADPIDWNISKQYEANTVVVNEFTGIAYLSTQPVPSGVDVTNTDYWTPIFTLDFVNMNKNITLRNDGNNNNATFASDIGDWLIVGGQLYKVIQDISLHTAYVVGFNIEVYSVELFVRDYLNQVLTLVGDLDGLTTSDKTSVVNAINSVLSDLNDTIGDLDDLTTSDKTSVVNAINSVLSDLNNTIGDLDDLTTSDKTSVVNAINSVVTDFNLLTIYATPEEFGAKGDGTTDDTTAINAAFASGKPVVFGTKMYIITNTINVPAHGIAFFNGATIKRKSGVPTFDMIAVSDYVTLHDGTVDGTASEDDLSMAEASDRFRGIAILNCHNVTLSNMKVINTCSAEAQPEGQKAAIHIMEAYYIKLINCDVIDNYASGIMFNVGTVHNCSIIGGLGKNNYGSGITGSCDYLEVSNFTADGNGYTGISLNGSYNVCTNCISKNNGTGNPWVEGSFSGFTIGHEQRTKGTQLSNCISEYNTLDGVSIGGGTGINISNCYFRNNERFGVYCGDVNEGTGDDRSANIVNCFIYDNGNVNIRVQNNSSLMVNNCRIKGIYGIDVFNSQLKIYDSILSMERLEYSGNYVFISLNNANITIENIRATSNNTGGSGGRFIQAATASSKGSIKNVDYANFEYLLYEAVAGCDLRVELIPLNVELTNDTNGFLYVITTSSGMVTYQTIVNNTTQNFVLPAYLRPTDSFDVTFGNGEIYYTNSTHTISATSTTRTSLFASWKLTTPEIRRV